jgi:hypothetical protein
VDEEATVVTDSLWLDPEEALIVDEEGNDLGDAASSSTSSYAGSGTGTSSG